MTLTAARLNSCGSITWRGAEAKLWRGQSTKSPFSWYL